MFGKRDSSASTAADRLHPTVRRYVGSRAIAAGYDECFARNLLFHYDCRFIDEYIRPGARVLDVGCGTGRHLTHLSRRGVKPVGLDLGAHFLQCAADNLTLNQLSAGLIRADFFQLPLLSTARFDGILLLFSVLGLIEGEANRRHLLTTLRPHLQPEGVLLAHVHNRGFATPKLTALRDQLRKHLGLGEAGDHIMRGYRGIQDLFMHSFTVPEITRLFTTCGYRIIELRPLNQARDGVYAGPNADGNANGFLIAATSAGKLC